MPLFSGQGVKDQYFGDINDFQKYRLLRILTGGGAGPGHGAGTTLSVCWMLTPPDGRTDGRHTRYLDHPEEWAGLDPALFEFLRDAVRDGATGREVSAIERSGLLGRATFHSTLVPEAAPARARFLADALSLAAGADLVFFDPDNGLEVRSVAYGRAGSSKYLYWREVEETYAQGHSMLIYQHFPRVARGPYVEDLAAELGRRCGADRVIAFATPGVVFLLVPQRSHRRRFETAAEAWGRSLFLN